MWPWEETVENYLLECPLHVEERKNLRKNVGMGKMKVEKLLGDLNPVKHGGIHSDNKGLHI